jgi:hypothetical protein
MSFQMNCISNNIVVRNSYLTIVLSAFALSQRAPINYVMSVGVCLFLRITRAHIWGEGWFREIWCWRLIKTGERIQISLISGINVGLCKSSLYTIYCLVPATLSGHAIFLSEINIIKLLFPSFVFLSCPHYQRVFLLLDGFQWYFILGILRIPVQKIQIWLKPTKLVGTLHVHEDLSMFFIIVAGEIKGLKKRRLKWQRISL